MKILCVILCCYLFSLPEPVASATEEGNLIMAHILFRHGERTPLQSYPNDPWKDLSNWPAGWGQLTNSGKKQMWELGKWIRKNYNSLINETYQSDEIYVQSTDVDRTLMSAQCNLAGLYPPQKEQIWDENIHWQPIPVHTKPILDDIELYGGKNCTVYNMLMKNFLNSELVLNLREENNDLLKDLSDHTGLDIQSFELLQRIFDCFKIEKLSNKKIPEWAESVYERLKNVTGMSFLFGTYTPELARLKGGPLIKDILDRFTKKIEKTLIPNRSLWLYSAHDITIINTLNTLHLLESSWVPYAAAVIFELRIIEEIPHVSILYKTDSDEPRLLDIPSCGVRCPLDKMYAVYKHVIPISWEKECEASILTKITGLFE